MSLPRFGHGNISLIDPLTLNGSVWDSFEGAVSVLDSAPPTRRQSNPNPNPKDVAHAITMAGAQIDW